MLAQARWRRAPGHARPDRLPHPPGLWRQPGARIRAAPAGGQLRGDRPRWRRHPLDRAVGAAFRASGYAFGAFLVAYVAFTLYLHFKRPVISVDTFGVGTTKSSAGVPSSYYANQTVAVDATGQVWAWFA